VTKTDECRKSIEFVEFIGFVEFVGLMEFVEFVEFIAVGDMDSGSRIMKQASRSPFFNP